MTENPRRFLGVSLLALLNLSVMTSLRNLPLVSEYGFGAPFFYLLIAFIFLFPSALVSAELATGWREGGGIYTWVKEAFGPRLGFFAVWMQWIHNVTWFPAILSFSATALAYLINPELAENKLYLITCILGGFWGFTFFNCYGLKTSSWFSACGVVAGTIIPGAILIGLGMIWIGKGYPIQIEFSFNALIPKLDNLESLVFLAGLFLAFGGMEVSAAHAKEVQNPQKTFPRAVLIAALSALLIYAAGALSIALMVPKEKISLVAGLMEAFSLFLGAFHLKWMIIPLSLMIIFGAVGELNAWIIGPVRALHASSQHGDLPPILKRLNRRNIPVNLLIFQGVIVTLSSFVFLLMPSASSAFWILSAMSVQIYLIMYILMFLAAIKLRYSRADVERAYKIPYGKTGIWIVGLTGASGCICAFFLSFIPPSQLNIGNLFFYESFLTLGLGSMALIPLIFYKWKHAK